VGGRTGNEKADDVCVGPILSLFGGLYEDGTYFSFR
jgi:hypothetical protein